MINDDDYCKMKLKAQDNKVHNRGNHPFAIIGWIKYWYVLECKTS
jgi:hypothetical protein